MFILSLMGTIPVVTHLVCRNECMPVGGDLLALLIVFYYSLRSTSVTTFVTMVATAAPASFPITSFSLFECLLFLLLLIFLGFNLTLLPLTYLTIAALVFWVQI